MKGRGIKASIQFTCIASIKNGTILNINIQTNIDHTLTLIPSVSILFFLMRFSSYLFKKSVLSKNFLIVSFFRKIPHNAMPVFK